MEEDISAENAPTTAVMHVLVTLSTDYCSSNIDRF